jgi:hypothetical protein
MCCAGDYTVAVLSIQKGFGRHITIDTPSNVTAFTMLIFISEPLWVWSLTFVKISVAFLLLRIKKSTPWKLGMGGAIFYLVASAIIITGLQFTECRPLRMYWDPKTPGGSCRDPH